MKEKARGNSKILKTALKIHSTKMKINRLIFNDLKGIKREYFPLTCW
jgi:hypothetical protein